jgi:hypothetical protein
LREITHIFKIFSLWTLPPNGRSGNMTREFHIVASDSETRFTLKGTPGTSPEEFSSLFEAARHARTASGGEDGFVMIYGEGGLSVNRIPLHP